MEKRCLGYCGKLIPFDPRNPGNRLCVYCRKAKLAVTLSKAAENQNQMKIWNNEKRRVGET